MFHVELRQFPHNVCRFNLSEAELFAALLRPWSDGQPVDFEERKWSPHTARLTVLEGPELPVQQLSMGRGWRTAERQGKDVTEQVLSRAREDAPGTADAAPRPAASATAVASTTAATPETSAASAALGARLTALLGDDPAALLAAWRLASERRPELAPSESLALAEATLASLDERR